MIAHLYRIENKITGEYYLGKHRGIDQSKQRGKYWGSGNRIKNQINKYGKENFTYTVLVIGEENYIYELESKLVTKELIESDEKCLNLAPGGEGCLDFINEKYKNCPVTFKKGKKKTEEHKQKLKLARAKQVFSKEHYRMVGEKNRNLVWMHKDGGNKRVQSEFVDEYILNGWLKGRAQSYITTEYKQKLREKTKKQWTKLKELGFTGSLTKI